MALLILQNSSTSTAFSDSLSFSYNAFLTLYRVSPGSAINLEINQANLYNELTLAALLMKSHCTKYVKLNYMLYENIVYSISKIF